MTCVNEVKLDSNEEWLVRNALSCYREAIVKCRDAETAEAVQARATGEIANAEANDRLARSWQETIERVDALTEKLG